MKKVFNLIMYSSLVLFLTTQCQNSNIKSNNGSEVWPKTKKEMHPWARWWWMGSAVDKKNIERELTLFADAGIGGVEITPIYGAKGYESKYIDFLSPEWVKMLKVTVQKGNSLGMGVDMNLGTGWPYGGPQIKPEDAAGKLIVEIFDMKAGHDLNEKIVVRDTMQQRMGARLKAITAYGSNGEIINIIDKVDENGNLIWKPKTGNWKIYAAFGGHTGQMVKRAAPGGAGLVMNHLSKDALKVYLKRFDDAFGKGNIGVGSFFNDSYEVYGADFSSDLFDEFLKRRGYDVRNYLRELVSSENSDQTARIRSDYRLTMSEMVYENFSVPWHQWVNGRGALARNQAHGFPGNILDIYANVDIPEPETFGINRVPVPGMKYYTNDTRNVPPDIVMIKFASSASDLLGKPYTSCETFTWLGEHFKVPLSNTKPEVERVFLSGVNHVFFHGTTYSPEEAGWPGWLFYASTNFAPSNSFWPHLKGLTEYITRCQSILQTGKSDNEIMLYWPYADVRHYAPAGSLDMMVTIHAINEWLKPTPFYNQALQLMGGGYSVDFISDMLISKCVVNNGMLKAAPEGPEYQVLVVPKTDFMPVETFANMLKLAENGATIILEKIPNDVPGLGNLGERRQQLKQLITSLKFTDVGDGIMQAVTGKGQILVSNDVQKALQFRDIYGENIAATGLKFIRRNINGNKYYFMVNHNSQAVDGYIPLNVQAASVMILDPQTGNFGLAETSNEGKITKVRLQLEPGNAIILQTSKEKILNNKNWNYIDSVGDPMFVSGKWKLKFTSGGPFMPKSQTLDRLSSWTTLPDENASYFSGTGEYSTTFLLTKKDAADYVIDLGDVRESARLWVNGKDAGILWHVPFKGNIGKYLKEGNNTLKIEVANLMANRIIYMDKKKIEWRKFNEINFINLFYEPFDASDWKPMESGLLGPVTITPVN
jgi:Glycosyl hydrolases family 2, sugar binding domain.